VIVVAVDNDDLAALDAVLVAFEKIASGFDSGKAFVDAAVEEGGYYFVDSSARAVAIELVATAVCFAVVYTVAFFVVDDVVALDIEVAFVSFVVTEAEVVVEAFVAIAVEVDTAGSVSYCSVDVIVG